MTMTSKRAKVIVFEGPDGVGKTTQVALLTQALWNNGWRVSTIKFPLRGTLTGDAIYRMLDSGWATRFPTVFQAVQLVDKLIPQMLCMPYILKSNDYIVLDRWNDSCLVYGMASGVAPWFMRLASKLLLDPDLVVVLDGDGHRQQSATEGDAYERDNAFQARVKAEYLALAAANPLTHHVVDSSGQPRAVQNRVWSILIDKGFV